MTFKEAVGRATEAPGSYNVQTEAIDRFTHAVVALALAVKEIAETH